MKAIYWITLVKSSWPSMSGTMDGCSVEILRVSFKYLQRRRR